MSYYSKRWFRSKTILFGGFITVLGAVVQYMDTVAPTIAVYFGKWGGLVVVVIGVVNVLLRFYTVKPIRTPP